MKLYVIRHGQTATNACKGMVGKKQVYSLTEKGEEFHYLYLYQLLYLYGIYYL